MAHNLVNWVRWLLVMGVFITSSKGQENAEAQAQVLTPSNFNIAQGRTVTVNATCGSEYTGRDKGEVYCKLVGYDSLHRYESNEDILRKQYLADNHTYTILDGHICDYCYAPEEAGTYPDKVHPPEYVVDGDTNTRWQSPPISRGIRFNRVTLEIDLQQLFQVAYVVVTMANSPRPGVWALERSIDNGQTWQPWQYFAGNNMECYKHFNMYSFESRDPKMFNSDDEVICTTQFSKVLPIEDGEIFVPLTTGRPSAKNPSSTLQKWIQATNIRLRLIQTKTMLGDLMSVAQGDSTVTRRYYYSIKEIDVGGRCVCNGHAFVCPPSPDDKDLLQCKCEHNTAGINCEKCAEGYVQKRWRQNTAEDPFVCEKCNCNGHSDKCHFDEEVERNNLSMDNKGQMLGGGSCDECQHHTKGINCHECEDKYYRPEGVLPNATEPCIDCDCPDPKKHTGNCEVGTGKCECSEAYRGADDCSKCADGYYDYPDCKPCDCFANGTMLDERGIPFCVSDTGEVQCPCKENFAGEFCDRCAPGYYNFPECKPCECNAIGINNDTCDAVTGQCDCKTNYGQRQCDACADGYFSFPTCSACNCEPKGSKPEICDKYYGDCICMDGFNGVGGSGISRCDRCEPGYFGFPNCQNCSCAEPGSLSNVCDEMSGKCSCKREYGGRQCDECSPGFFNYPECSPCKCNPIGSRGASCDQTDGKCRCKANFEGDKCDKCIEDRYNYPLCEECNCNPDGVPPTFFADGGCANVAPGTLCTCKERVEGRICDTCKPLFWNLEGNNPLGCSDCGCFRNGTIGRLGVCDNFDGQCACKPFVGTPPPGEEARVCSQCKDGYYGLEDSNGFGCKHCQCDVGGTEKRDGRMQICDKDNGQCACKRGMTGRKCDDVLELYYLPTFHQFKKEIEDGYRQDNEIVRIGYKDEDFPGYSWRGYGVYSQLQDEVWLDVPITNPSTYQFILRYTNPNPTPVEGKITMHASNQVTDGGTAEGSGEGAAPGSVTIAETVENYVVLPPTGGQPAFVTVSGLDRIYPSSFDLTPGEWKTSVKIENKDPSAEDVLVDYFVLVPKEYYDPTILKEDVYVPCLAGDRRGEILPLCAHYTYPELYGQNQVMSTESKIPGRDDVPYGSQVTEDLLGELQTRKLTSVANYQPKLQFPLQVRDPNQEHVIAVVFFTPGDWKSNETSQSMMIQAGPMGPRGDFEDVPQKGEAYIYNCPYSSLCRQVVIDEEGRVKNFKFKDMANPTVELVLNDDQLEVGIDSIVAIPIDQWSTNFVTPQLNCVRTNGVCASATYPNAPGPSETALVPFSSQDQPQWVVIDANNPLPDVNGKVPNPGVYVLVATYKQNNPEVTLNMNITRDVQDPDNFYEAVLPLPTCMKEEGCRSIIERKDSNDGFDLDGDFVISTKYPEGPINYPVSIESVIAIPSNDFSDIEDRQNYLMPEMTDQTGDYAKQCAKDYWQIDTNPGFCRNALVSIVADFNEGAFDCDCKPPGALGYDCEKFGGQCRCKPNVIGRQCTRCKPGFFGFPDCKQCKCPPTATCDEETGDCICAPHVTGTEENPCSMCEENTFGYDPITGCQECDCSVEGTINGNMSCSLESGNCYCKENVEGRKCDACTAGAYDYPNCLTCPCDITGTEPEICNQQTAECKCKENVEGECCNTCVDGTFDLQANNPDGCTDCICSGKTTFCKSHNHLVRSTIENMNGWKMHAFQFSRSRKEIGEKRVSEETLPMFVEGELDVSFTNYPDIDPAEYTFYYKAPESYLRNKIRTYGGAIQYNLLYSGYEIQNDIRGPPDVILRGANMDILHRSGRIIENRVATDFTVQMDPIDWRQSDGQSVSRKDLMVMLANLKGLYIRAAYSNERDGRVILKNVAMDYARVAKDTELKNVSAPDDGSSTEDSRRKRSSDNQLFEPFHSRVVRQAVDRVCEDDPLDTCQLDGECVTSVELCQCPEGYHGFSCEDCSVGYYRSSEDPLGPVCEKCECFGHAETCHPITGECVTLQCVDGQCPPCVEGMEGCGTPCVGDECEGPESDPQTYPDPVVYCHFNPDKCVVPTPIPTIDVTWTNPHCKHNTTGIHCESCAEGFFGDATLDDGSPGDNCQPCYCPLQENNFALSCGNGPPDVCVCKPNYIGDDCGTCGPGYYGEPNTIGDFCKPCECNGNINTTVTGACNDITGICQECLYNTFGDHCERCEDWYYGDAIQEKNCRECECNRDGTESCDHETGQCTCKPGVEGALCDRCMPDYFDFGNPNGCQMCNCSVASVRTQCDLETGQCECKPGVSGQKCERCNTGFWNLQDDGCERCKCKTEFAVGASCRQEDGQCECLPGVVGINCDGCPRDWVLVVNDTRAVKPEWKLNFDYDEGCFPCTSCVSDSLRSLEEISGRFQTVYQPFRENGGTAQFAQIRLKKTDDELKQLLPEIGLLDPVERLERLQPLERQASDFQTKAKSLNVEYKLEKMLKLKSEAEELETSAREAILDMSKVRSQIMNTTNEMSEIAAGLGSGVSQDQIRTSIEYGEQFLQEIKDRDFSEYKTNAYKEQATARELVANVSLFTLPGKIFKQEVENAENKREELESKLEDLKSKSQTAGEEVRFASTLNFKNANSPAAFKRNRINDMIKESKDNNELGRKMENSAKTFLKEATKAFENLNNEHTTMEGAITLLESGLEQNNQLIADNNAKMYEAQLHAQGLENQADNLRQILEQTKEPAAETLKAASAYETIASEINEAKEAADDATTAADKLASMTVGIKGKADQSKERTNQLMENAQRAKTQLADELTPNLQTEKEKMDEIAMKNKNTKQSVEEIISNIKALEGQREVLKSTVQEADDAETIAHDALISIAQRAEEITEKLKITNALQQNHTEMSFAIGATKKALEELEKKRQKREVEEEDFKNRVERLMQRNKEIDEIRKANAKMLADMKLKIKKARSKVADLKKLGVTFNQGSSLELRNPPRLTELASCTQVSFFFNVTKSDVGESAFLFYLGNEDQTHQKMPLTSTDDYMALEIIRGGYVKLSVDLGRGEPFEIISNAPINYDQWHKVIVDRRGHYVTLTVKSEEGVGEVTEDKKVDVLLPRIDLLGRPIGDVFNIHPEYTRIFVGGFPFEGDDRPRIQETVRETDMNGQIEGLEIGGEAVSLWNFKKMEGIMGARPRDKFRTKTDESVRFGGLGFISIPNIKSEHFANVNAAFNIKLKFKTVNGNGLLIVMGNEVDGDFVCLELVNQVVRYSFNLGDGGVTLESTNQTALNVWQTVEIQRNGRQGTLIVNGATHAQSETQGQLDRLSVEGNLYLGGYPGSPSYDGISNGNFSGCIESLHLDGDPIDLSKTLQNGETIGVRAGCAVEPVTLATFPPASPGYIQLRHMDLTGRMEISFMFRTLQEQALLYYMCDANKFYWVSLSLINGGKLQLNVFPSHELSTGSAVSYNDNKWHVVSIVITESLIQLRVDDYEDEKLDIQDSQEELPLMTTSYRAFIGGVPQDIVFPHAASASEQSFIGCVRDVLIDTEVTDFNVQGVLYKTPGVEIGGVCKTSGDPVEPDLIEPGQGTLAPPVDTPATERPIPATTPGWGSNFGEDTTQPPSILAPTYGECKLPYRPAIDPDERVRGMKGLRFGTRSNTYLEFYRQLKVKRRSEFSIEFKTSHRNGIIFYVANSRNVDFIALYMKNGRIIYGFNCGSGTAFIQSNRRYDDGQWHAAMFSRVGKNGVLKIDGNLEGETQAAGQTEYIEVEKTFFLGNLKPETLQLNVVKNNLQDVRQGFVGCLNNLRLRDKMIGRWKENKDVIPCSEKVEPGYFFGPGGGSIMVYRQFRVGLDFDITMSIKPRNVTGLLLAIQGRRDYLILQMVDGSMTFTVDNGRGPITAVFKPEDMFTFCDGKWHEIHAVKAKNVVTLSVDDIFAQPGIGVPGVSSTDTKHGLFIGGHPRPERLTALATGGVDYVGCVKDIVIEGKQIQVEDRMLRGNMMSHICPTI